MSHSITQSPSHLLRLLALAILLSAPTLKAEQALGTAKGERVIILGGTFAERMQYFGYFESLIARSQSSRDLVFRNMGWAGDEVALQPRSYNFIRSAGTGVPDDPNPGYGDAHTPDADHRILTEHLKAQKADTLLLCFGANESFKGKAGLSKFASDYQKLIEHLSKHKFNGKTPPRLILVSPIAQEKLGEPYPDPQKRNENLKLYSEQIGKIAKKNDLVFVNLFVPTQVKMSDTKAEPFTIDGYQLNDRGQRMVAEELAATLGITDPWSDELESLRKLVVEKNKQFFFRWRPINGEYVYGRRREPFGVVSFPPEMQKLDEMIADLDQQIFAEAEKLNPSE